MNVLYVIAGILVGFYCRQVWDILKKIDAKIQPEVKQGVVRRGNIVTPVHTKDIDDGKPAVVKPKSAQRIKIEEEIKFNDRFL